MGEAALRGIGKAAELIDLNEAPRSASAPGRDRRCAVRSHLRCYARTTASTLPSGWRRRRGGDFKIPTYLYEAAARKPERVNLENIRRGQFEGVRDEIANNPHRHPDFGEAALHPTAGATVVGARKFLIAYNINLNTPDVAPAKAIAKKIRASSGGFPCVKAMGVDLKARNLTQVSMNLTDFETTSMAKVYEAVELEASALGLQVVGSEIVGLVPRKALEAASVHFLRIENYRPELVVENRLEQVLAEQQTNSLERDSDGDGRMTSQTPLRLLVESYVTRVAEPTPTPGGGSVAALAGALAAALGEMVCGASLKRKSLAAHHQALEAARSHLETAREKFLAIVDRDPQSYEALMQAFKLPKATESERTARGRAVEVASKQASRPPLETAELAARVAQEISSLSGITIPQAAADLSVAANLAETARRAGLENLQANLPGVQDSDWLKEVQARLSKLELGSSSGLERP